MENEKINQLIHEKIMNLKVSKPSDYADSISFAWKVVERMEKRGYLWDAGKDFKEYFMDFYRADNQQPQNHNVGCAYEFPKAICLAALKAVGENV